MPNWYENTSLGRLSQRLITSVERRLRCQRMDARYQGSARSPSDDDECVRSKAEVEQMFFTELVHRTDNFGSLTWLGKPIWQNLLDLWTIQETIYEVQPALLLETGTNRGGSAYFYAHLFDLLGRGQVLTCDLKPMHEVEHPRIQWLIGDSVGEKVFARMRAAAEAADGPVMVILDSDHTADHVEAEIEHYATLVTPGSYILVQDGVIDTLPIFAPGRPGPLVAIHRFLARHPEFEVDGERSQRFLISHHPDGWLRRRLAT